MSYLTLTDLEGKIPPAFLNEALDDDRDGVIDAFDRVAADVSEAIDGILSTRYQVPFTTVPRVVSAAAKTLAAEQCYKRRGVPDDKNPWKTDADAMRKLLHSIARGEIQLQVSTPAVEAVAPSASIVLETSRLGSPGRTLG